MRLVVPMFVASGWTLALRATVPAQGPHRPTWDRWRSFGWAVIDVKEERS
jgi:hypothetical protein